MIYKKYSFILLKIVYLTCSLCLAIENNPAKNQTFIIDKLPVKNTANYTYWKDKSADKTPGDSAMLLDIPGMTLTQSGGPLSFSTIRYRGLADSRFAVKLEDIALNNPINGLSDANSMFLFAAKNLGISAQSMSITLPTPDSPQAQGSIGYGSHNTIKWTGLFGTPLDPFSSIFTAAQLASTDGQFSYASPDLPSDDTANEAIRYNNDQHRVSGLVKYQRKTSDASSHALLAVSAHEGGLPGFAFSPQKHLRQRSIYAGLNAFMSKTIRQVELSIDLSNCLFGYGSKDKPDHDEHFLASTHELTLGLKSLKLPQWFQLEIGQKFVLEQAYELNKTRFGTGLLINRLVNFDHRLKPSIYYNTTILVFNHHGFLFKNDIGLSFEPAEYITITGRIIGKHRLPTFMELYANNQFFVGNTELNKESIWDIELSTNLRFKHHTRADITAFFGSLRDVIIYVPFLSTKLRPSNIESANRYGIELSLTLEPLDWLALETKNSLLATKIKATNAPLPHAPAFSGLSKIRFGSDDYLALSLQSRYRTSATSTIYGTLLSKPYILFDAFMSARFFDRLSLSLSISNIFNIKTARDSYEIPLPGTVFFTQFEIGNL